MKGNHILFGLAMILLFSFSSCSTTYMPLSQVPNAQELGSVSTSFETNVKTGMGFLGGAGMVVGGAGGYLIGSSIVSFFYDGDNLKIPSISSDSKVQLATGGALVGAGFGLALVQDLVINLPKRAIINKAAKEALLAAASQSYSEDIDVRDIQYTYVQKSGTTHGYNATGVVIKKE